MKTDLFLQYFAPYILDSFLKVPEISTTEGVLFFYPTPVELHKKCIFLGRNHEWMRLLDDGILIDECTYLICTTLEFHNHIPSGFNRRINVLFLNMSIFDVLQLLDRITCGSPNYTHPDGEHILIDFFRTISIQNIPDHESMLQWQSRFPYPLKIFLAAIVVRPEYTGIDKESRGTIHENLSAFFLGTNLFYYHNEWIILYSQDELASDQLSISYGNFSMLLARLNLFAGISYVGVIPENFYTLYLTASASMELGLKINLPSPHKRIYSFTQYHTLYLIHLSARQYDQLHHQAEFYYMAHPDVVRIYLYDKAHNADLLDTLYAFLINNSSLSQTAQYSFMHRNTIYNKLSKIGNIIGYPISEIKENSVFILSYMVIRYYRDFQNNDIYENIDSND